jgi:hypothetical protein
MNSIADQTARTPKAFHPQAGNLARTDARTVGYGDIADDHGG